MELAWSWLAIKLAAAQVSAHLLQREVRNVSLLDGLYGVRSPSSSSASTISRKEGLRATLKGMPFS